MHRLEFNSRTVEGLIAEALILQREARHLFAGSHAALTPELTELLVRQEEHALARLNAAVGWLHEQRSHFAGEISLFRLRLTRRLPANPPLAREDELVSLPENLLELIQAIEQHYARLCAAEQDWRRRERPLASALARLRK